MNPLGLRSRQWTKLLALAEEIREANHRPAARAADEVYWSALQQAGGFIVPAIVRERGAWKKAGEYANIPARFLRANTLRPPTGRAEGNVDTIAQIIRDETGDDSLTESDVLNFFAEAKRTGGQQAGNGDREAMGYTKRETERAKALMRKEGLAVSLGEAEGFVQAALVAYDGGARYSHRMEGGMTAAERKRAHRDRRRELGLCTSQVKGCEGDKREGCATCANCGAYLANALARDRERKRADVSA